ncbi:MAG: ATP-binding protein [Polyangiales bacterium]
MLADLGRRLVEPFVPDELRRDSENERVARLLVSACLTVAPLTFALATGRWAFEGPRSHVGALVGFAATVFAVVPFVVRATASSKLGARLVLGSGLFTMCAMAFLEDGLASEGLIWMSLIPIAAALLRGERAVFFWSAATLAAVGLVAARDLHIALPGQTTWVALHTAAAVGAVVFGAVLGRSYERGRGQILREVESREQRWRALIESMPDALLRIDTSGRIVDVHLPRQPSDLPLVLRDLIGREVAAALPDRVGARILSLGEEARAQSKPVRDDAVSFAGLHVQVVVVLLPEGETLAILRDVSALVAAQRERARADERADMLAASVKQRDEFLSVASHELRTPLTAMKLWVQRVDRMSDAHRQDVPPRMLEAHAKISAQVGRLETLVDELLDVSRLLENRLRLELAPVRLDEVVRDVVSRFELEAARLSCPIEADIQIASGRWDRSRLDQIATNLVSNALKYAPGKPIEVRVRGNATEARFSVHDRGMGIAPSDQSKIFERFERLPGAKRLGGLGLGLWITRRLVESMGGRIEIQSRPGEGSTFTVILPTHPPPQEDALRRAG